MAKDPWYKDPCTSCGATVVVNSRDCVIYDLKPYCLACYTPIKVLDAFTREEPTTTHHAQKPADRNRAFIVWFAENHPGGNWVLHRLTGGLRQYYLDVRAATKEIDDE